MRFWVRPIHVSINTVIKKDPRLGTRTAITVHGSEQSHVGDIYHLHGSCSQLHLERHLACCKMRQITDGRKYGKANDQIVCQTRGEVEELGRKRVMDCLEVGFARSSRLIFGLAMCFRICNWSHASYLPASLGAMKAHMRANTEQARTSSKTLQTRETPIFDEQ